MRRNAKRGQVETRGGRSLLRTIAGFAAGALALLGATAFAPAADAEDAASSPHVAIAARLAGDESRVRLVLDFEREPDFELHYLENPYRAVIDLPETVFVFPEGSLQQRGLVKSIRYGNSGNARARMVFEFAAPVKMELAEAGTEAEGAIHRMVFDITIIEQEDFSAEVSGSDWPEFVDEDRAEAATPPGDTLKIVVDAGHGGIDGGAEGPAGSMEKDITLAFAESLKAALEEKDGIRVAMTRTDDSFLSLSARVRRARDEAADLLISLHADSIAVRSLRGATVYTLSDKASDAVAQSLVDQENREDAIVGVSLENAPEDIAAILVDLARTETRVFSTGLAQQVITSFEGQVRLINNPLRHAGFRVLQAPDVPSVLVEMGYLSNREDEKLLNDEEWRENTAQLLAQSVENYRETILAGRR
ncbi:N-acetylmuramoyl-L-alanine amidase [uncultured Hoeflea sp.]|uniref:N-acetylmuramoyl-L-alanine amidase n=1 Tax=uncultured Hoeflea sp. TaxID=538666 RepID=UPI0030EE3D35|tara:strand:+ start:39854 stop:41113 length:1260 start_codon:yes stop_codon:yes gene_type:complete